MLLLGGRKDQHRYVGDVLVVVVWLVVNELVAPSESRRAFCSSLHDPDVGEEEG